LDFLKVHGNLQEVMVLGGLDHLTSSCPSVFKELIARLVSPNTDLNTEAAGAAALSFIEVPASDMHRHLTGLLKSAEGTDVTFEVCGETISAHRCVLAARSTVFRAQLFGPMKEGTTTSAIVIRIDDMEARVFKLLLSFIYSDLMPDIEGSDDFEEDSAVDDAEVMWQHLLVAADRYDIQRLRLMCEEKLCGYISTTTVVTILALAEQHHCRGLKEACLDFLDFPANLQQVMDAGGLNYLSSSPSVLIDLIAKLASLKLNK
jgi:speckle-type POZ protein